MDATELRPASLHRAAQRALGAARQARAASRRSPASLAAHCESVRARAAVLVGSGKQVPLELTDQPVSTCERAGAPGLAGAPAPTTIRAGCCEATVAGPACRLGVRPRTGTPAAS